MVDHILTDDLVREPISSKDVADSIGGSFYGGYIHGTNHLRPL